MKQQFKFLDGILTIETVNGRTTAALTDADGNTSALEEVTADVNTLTDEQIERISYRFGQPRKNGQPF